IQIVQETPYRINGEHRLWFLEEILIRMCHAAMVSDRVHGIYNLREPAQHFLRLGARRLSLKLRVLLPDQVEESSDVGSSVMRDIRASADRNQISVKRRVNPVDTAHGSV